VTHPLRDALSPRLDPSAQGIWRYASLLAPPVAAEHRLSLGEGGTPLVRVPALESALGVARVWLKREDLAPGGSHKARSLAYRVSLARQRGEPALAISSSGNAAVAASMYAAAAGLPLLAFVAPTTNPAKLRWLERQGTTIITSPKPRNLARYAGRLFGIPNLTPSLDVLSIEGFKTIAAELIEQAEAVDHVFTFVTSGSSLVGMGRLYDELGGYPERSQPLLANAAAPPPISPLADAKTLLSRGACELAPSASVPLGPALHAVQTGLTPVIAGPWDWRFQRAAEAKSWQASKLAGLLGVDETPRADEARQWLRASGGAGWVEHDDDIMAAHPMLRDCGIDTSAEGAACLSAALRARQLQTLDASSRVVLVLCGHASQWPQRPPDPPAESSLPPDGNADTPSQTRGLAQRPPQLVEIAGYAELRAFLRQSFDEIPRDSQGDTPDE
jgi:threonine synthase